MCYVSTYFRQNRRHTLRKADWMSSKTLFTVKNSTNTIFSKILLQTDRTFTDLRSVNVSTIRPWGIQLSCDTARKSLIDLGSHSSSSILIVFFLCKLNFKKALLGLVLYITVSYRTYTFVIFYDNRKKVLNIFIIVKIGAIVGFIIFIQSFIF